MCNLQVRGFSQETSDDTLEYYFENKKRSGGGDIKHFQMDREEGCALITYEKQTGKELDIDATRKSIICHYVFKAYQNVGK